MFNLFATMYRLQQRDKVETRTNFSSHSGNAYEMVFDSENGAAFTYWKVFAASPTTSNFNALPICSELYNTANGVKYRKTGATTWATVTQS